MLLKKFCELQEYTTLKIGKAINEQNEKFNKEIENIKKNPEILQLKNN